jgi:hypothetical protein
MSVLNNLSRNGNFTSSEIFKLLSVGSRPMTEKELDQHIKDNPKSKKKNIADGFGELALTYIDERNLERKLGRSLDTQVSTRDTLWGNFLEKRVEEILPFGYSLTSNKTDAHPTIKCWKGSKDFMFENIKIAELKCYQPKKFAKYTDMIMLADVDFFREEFPQEYWQIVSNSIINQVTIGEAISYMPYRSELQVIRDMADSYYEPDHWNYRFIIEGEDNTLAYLPDGGYYKNLNRFEFEIPQEDIDLLTERVLMASKLLVNVERKLEIQ